jgi:hypothetical protein
MVYNVYGSIKKHKETAGYPTENYILFSEWNMLLVFIQKKKPVEVFS